MKLDEDEAFVITPPTAEGQVAVFGSLSNDSMKLLPPDHPDARRWDACIAVLKGDARTGERKLYWEAQIAGRLQHPRCRREGSREPKNQSAQGIQNCSLKG